MPFISAFICPESAVASIHHIPMLKRPILQTVINHYNGILTFRSSIMEIASVPSLNQLTFSGLSHTFINTCTHFSGNQAFNAMQAIQQVKAAGS